MNPLRIVFAFAAIVPLLLYFASRPNQADQAMAHEARFDQAWSDTVQLLVLKKSDRLPLPQMRVFASSERPAVEEDRNESRVARIGYAPKAPHADAPASVSSVAVARSPDVVRQRRHAKPSNICTRHGMRKVVTRGGRSWRCRR